MEEIFNEREQRKLELLVLLKVIYQLHSLNLGETNLIYCSKSPTDLVIARKKENNNIDSPIGFL